MASQVGISERMMQQDITEAERGELLRRLGFLDNVLSGPCVLADVIRATQAEPREAAATLARIRQEAWEATFGVRSELIEHRQGDQSRLVARPAQVMQIHERRLVLRTKTKDELLKEIEEDMRQFRRKSRWFVLVAAGIMAGYVIYANATFEHSAKAIVPADPEPTYEVHY